MMKIGQIVCLCLLFFVSAYGAEHLIFFGDSWSDTGNYPEPQNIAHPQLKNFNLYVPISNPVPQKLYGTKGFPSRAFLRASIKNSGKINAQSRSQYSINWPLYFTYNYYNKQRVSPVPALVSWYQIEAKQAPISSSNINYAWASAVAGSLDGHDPKGGQCFHVNGLVYKGSCTIKSLIEHRNRYWQETNNPYYDKNHDYRYAQIQIPDLNKQVNLYLQHGIKAHSKIFIYIGANDIGNFLKPHILTLLFSSAKAFRKQSLEPQMKIVANHVQVAVQRIQAAYAKAKISHYHIYILTLPYLSNLHEAYTYQHLPIIGWLFGSRIVKTIDAATDIYNQDLNSSLRAKPHVSLIDLGAHINKLAASKTYAESIKQGDTCIGSTKGAYTLANPQGNDCHYKSGGVLYTYFSWNNAHFTSSVNNSVATYLLTKV